MEDGCLQENWRDSQHSWLKDVETEKRVTQTGSVLIDLLESRCTEKDGNIGIYKDIKSRWQRCSDAAGSKGGQPLDVMTSIPSLRVSRKHNAQRHE